MTPFFSRNDVISCTAQDPEYAGQDLVEPLGTQVFAAGVEERT